VWVQFEIIVELIECLCIAVSVFQILENIFISEIEYIAMVNRIWCKGNIVLL